MIAFACEPIHTTLDCLIKEQTLEKLEIKLGVLQVNFNFCYYKLQNLLNRKNDKINLAY